MMDSNEEELTKIVVDLDPDFCGLTGESLWAKSLGNDLYEIRNSPWYTTEINYLDVVKAVAPSEDKKPVFVDVFSR